VVRRFLDRWARQLVRRGIRSGLIEGSNLWLSIGAIAWLFRFLSKRQAPQVSVERLRLGESVVVSHVPAPPRTRRARNKAARKAEKAARRQAKLVAKREASRRHARAAAKAGLAEAAAEERLARSSSRPGKSRRHEREERSARGRPPEPDLEEPGDT
jgi:hypothetical protein